MGFLSSIIADSLSNTKRAEDFLSEAEQIPEGFVPSDEQHETQVVQYESLLPIISKPHVEISHELFGIVKQPSLAESIKNIESNKAHGTTAKKSAYHSSENKVSPKPRENNPLIIDSTTRSSIPQRYISHTPEPPHVPADGSVKTPEQKEKSLQEETHIRKAKRTRKTPFYRNPSSLREKRGMEERDDTGRVIYERKRNGNKHPLLNITDLANKRVQSEHHPAEIHQADYTGSFLTKKKDRTTVPAPGSPGLQSKHKRAAFGEENSFPSHGDMIHCRSAKKASLSFSNLFSSESIPREKAYAGKDTFRHEKSRDTTGEWAATIDFTAKKQPQEREPKGHLHETDKSSNQSASVPARTGRDNHHCHGLYIGRIEVIVEYPSASPEKSQTIRHTPSPISANFMSAYYLRRV